MQRHISQSTIRQIIKDAKPGDHVEVKLGPNSGSFFLHVHQEDKLSDAEQKELKSLQHDAEKAKDLTDNVEKVKVLFTVFRKMLSIFTENTKREEVLAIKKQLIEIFQAATFSQDHAKSVQQWIIDQRLFDVFFNNYRSESSNYFLEVILWLVSANRKNYNTELVEYFEKGKLIDFISSCRHDFFSLWLIMYFYKLSSVKNIQQVYERLQSELGQIDAKENPELACQILIARVRCLLNQTSAEWLSQDASQEYTDSFYQRNEAILKMALPILDRSTGLLSAIRFNRMKFTNPDNYAAVIKACKLFFESNPAQDSMTSVLKNDAAFSFAKAVFAYCKQEKNNWKEKSKEMIGLIDEATRLLSEPSPIMRNESGFREHSCKLYFLKGDISFITEDYQAALSSYEKARELAKNCHTKFTVENKKADSAIRTAKSKIESNKKRAAIEVKQETPAVQEIRETKASGPSKRERKALLAELKKAEDEVQQLEEESIKSIDAFNQQLVRIDKEKDKEMRLIEKEKQEEVSGLEKRISSYEAKLAEQTKKNDAEYARLREEQRPVLQKAQEVQEEEQTLLGHLKQAKEEQAAAIGRIKQEAVQWVTAWDNKAKEFDQDLVLQDKKLKKLQTDKDTAAREIAQAERRTAAAKEKIAELNNTPDAVPLSEKDSLPDAAPLIRIVR